jgi:hypothetical protein
MLMRSSKIFSPSLVLPAKAENGLRPSSALRAVEAEIEISQEVGDGLRFQNDRVNARLERFRVTARERFADRLAGDPRRVEPADVEMAAREITGAHTVGRAARDGKTGDGAPLKIKISVFRGKGRGRRL